MTILRIKDIAKPTGPFGRTKLFADIAAGRLVVRKVGGATVILPDDYRRYLEGIPRSAIRKSTNRKPQRFRRRVFPINIGQQDV